MCARAYRGLLHTGVSTRVHVDSIRMSRVSFISGRACTQIRVFVCKSIVLLGEPELTGVSCVHVGM